MVLNGKPGAVSQWPEGESLKMLLRFSRIGELCGEERGGTKQSLANENSKTSIKCKEPFPENLEITSRDK